MNPGELRNRCQVRRPANARDGYGDVPATFTAAGLPVWVGIKPGAGRLRDYGPGDQPAALAEGRARYGTDIRLRDVLEVLSGPEAGTAWRVLAVFHPAKRHTQMQLEQHTGALA